MSRYPAKEHGAAKAARSKGRITPAFSFLGVVSGLKRDEVVKEAYAASGSVANEVFLAGGILRNAALSEPLSNDYDFVVSGGAGQAASLAKRLAARLKGSAFLLDAETGVYRVVVKRRAGPVTVDVAPFKGATLKHDLKARDFTVNALAVGLRGIFAGGPEVIDPCEGLKDARLRVLRAVSGKAFDDDPLRTLRAVRLSQHYGLRIDRLTGVMIKKKSYLLSKVSAERIRDELLIIFALPGSARAVERMYALGMAKAALPEFAGWKSVDGYGLLKHSLKTLAEAERLIAGLSEKTFPSGAHERLAKHFNSGIGAVKRTAAFKMAAFLHDAGKATTITRSGSVLRFTGHDRDGGVIVSSALKRLRFSGKAVRAVAGLSANHHRVFMFAGLKSPGKRAMEHLIGAAEKYCQGGAIDMILLSLADARATRGSEDKRLLAAVRDLLAFYLGAYKKKKPRPVLNGREIMRAFDIGEGRLVGEIMRLVAQGVQAGTVSGKKDAVAYVKERLAKPRVKITEGGGFQSGSS